MTGEPDVKIERLTRLAHEAGVAGIVLATQRNFAWLTGGGSNRIDGSREIGAGALLVTADGRRFVLANTIEMPRLMAEAVPGLGFKPIEYPWTDDQANPAMALDMAWPVLSASGPLAADCPLPDATNLEPAIMRQRAPLVDEEIARYRVLGHDMGVSVGEACRALQPGTTEDHVARVVAAAVCHAGARPVVLLVAGDERIARYRHPVPSDAIWRDRVMVVVCAERHGLIVALSRIVARGTAPETLGDRTRAAARVFGRLLAATQPGVTGSDLYRVAARAYEEAGFAHEERKHHQGGAIGYRSRDWIAHPRSSETVSNRQAFAWNPSITGTKIEDTTLAIDGRIEILTSSPEWPSIPLQVGAQTVHAADILVL